MALQELQPEVNIASTGSASPGCQGMSTHYMESLRPGCPFEFSVGTVISNDLHWFQLLASPLQCKERCEPAGEHLEPSLHFSAVERQQISPRPLFSLIIKYLLELLDSMFP